MRIAMPNAFPNAQPWGLLRRGSSKILPAILDDDEETDSTTCEVPDPSVPVVELLTSSGDERWSFGNDIGGPDSGEQVFEELSSTPHVGLYSSLSLHGAVAALSLPQGPVHDSAPTSAASSRKVQQQRMLGDSREGEANLLRYGTLQRHDQQLSPTQTRMIPSLPPAPSFGKTPPPKRSISMQPPTRLLGLGVEDLQVIAATAPRKADPRAISPETPLLPAAVCSDPNLLQPCDATIAFSEQQQQQWQQQAAGLQGDIHRSLSFNRSLSLAGSSLMPAACRTPSPSDETPIVSRAGVAGASPLMEFRTLQSHSAPPQLQLLQLKLRPQLTSHQQAILSPFAPPRLRTASQGQLRLLAPSPLPAPNITSPDASFRQPKLPPWATPWVPGAAGEIRSTRRHIDEEAHPAVLLQVPPPQPPVLTLQLPSAPSSQPLFLQQPSLHSQPSLHHWAPQLPEAPPPTAQLHLIQQQQSQPQSPQQLPPQQQIPQQTAYQQSLQQLSPQQTLQPPPHQQTSDQQTPQPLQQQTVESLQQPVQLQQPQWPRPQMPQPQTQLHQLQPPQQPMHPQHHELQGIISTPIHVRLPSQVHAPDFAPPPMPPPMPPRPLPPPPPGRTAAAAAAVAIAAVAAGTTSTRTADSTVRAARQSAPAIGRTLQLPGLHAGGDGGGTMLAAAGLALGAEAHLSGVGVLARGIGGPPAGEIPLPPEVTLRPPRWLKPSAFQVTEQLRSGRLQELVDKLVMINCPTCLDLGGLEFSGSFNMPAVPDGSSTAATTVAGAQRHPPVVPAAAVAATALGAVLNPTVQRQQVNRAPLHGVGAMTVRSRYLRTTPAAGPQLQVIHIPPGQHVTMYNATLLLTADQYILVGPGASLILKGVEIFGCSREAARQSAAMRRRALSIAAAAAVSASPVVQAAAAAAAVAAVTSTAATGYSKVARRSSSPGRTTREAGMFGVGSTVRRASIGDSAADGGGGGGGPGGLPPVRRRAATASSTSLFGLVSPLVAGAASATVAIQEVVDPNEYVDNHGLIEVLGGYAQISNCRLWPGRCQMALCISDGGGSSLSYTTAGACCAAGPKSCLISEHSSYDGGGAGCVSALDGARLSLTDCALRYPTLGVGSVGDSGGGGNGGAATTAVTGGCDVCIEARGSGTLAVLTNCDVANGGVTAAQSARLYLQSTRVSDARGHGLLASDHGTVLYVRDCRVDDSGRSSVVACEGAAVQISDSTLAGSNGPGVIILPTFCAAVAVGAAAEAEGTASAAAAAAAAEPPPPRSTLTLLRCDISANAGHGALVAGGGFLAVGDSVLYNNLGCGVAVEDCESVVSAVGMRLIRNEGHGVRATGGAGMMLTRCCATGNGRDGVALEGLGSRGHLNRCESRENRESGLCVTGAAAVELSYTRLAANQHDGLAVGGTGSLAAAHGCVLNGNVAKGAVVCMGGGAELSECAIHCNGSKSVQVSDEESRLVLGRACSLDRPPAATNGGVLSQV